MASSSTAPIKRFSVLKVVLICSFLSVCSCSKTLEDGILSNITTCKKIIISGDDGDNVLEFDDKGQLKTLWQNDVTEFYNKNKAVILLKQPDGSTLKVDIDAIRASLKLSNDFGDGFANLYIFDKINNEQKVKGSLSIGIDGNVDVTREELFYTYNSEGDCVEQRGTISIEDKKVQNFEANSFYTNYVSPFWKNPFQVFLEPYWRSAGMTNKHLLEAQQYAIVNYDERTKGLFDITDPYRVLIVGNVTYSYKFSGGRLTYIQIDREEKIKKVDVQTNEITTKTEIYTNSITIVYSC